MIIVTIVVMRSRNQPRNQPHDPPKRPSQIIQSDDPKVTPVSGIASRPLEQPSPISAPARTKVLVVEDEALIRDTVVFSLEEEGYEVHAIEDGRLALDLFYRSLEQHDSNAWQPDLVILDLMLPHVNGLDLCRFVRSQASTIPILILSAKGTETDRVVGLEVGADDYLTKPFGMRELIARCRALLRRSQRDDDEPKQDSLCRGDLELFPEQCRVSRNGQSVSLAPKEFKILELFMRNPNRVWSREQLLERVWGPDFMGDSKTVDVHIRWLREKLEVDPSHPQHIQTVRGFGYRFS